MDWVVAIPETRAPFYYNALLTTTCDNECLTAVASVKRTEAHQRKVERANKAAMSAAPSPAYIRRDEPDNPGNWVLVSPVLDPAAVIEQAAYYICTAKHKQPDLGT
jgi:hypothetical protein